MRHDLRFAFRTLCQNPRFTAAVVLVLALGIGANAAIFSVVYSVLLRPLPYHDPDRLMVVFSGHTGASPSSPPDYRDWKEQSRSFQSMSAVYLWNADLTGRDQAEQLTGLRVEGSLFELLGVPAALGRALGPHDSGANVVVLTHRLWMRRFHGDAAIVGQTIRLSGADYEVTGVMPEKFRFPLFWAPKAEMYVPLDAATSQSSNRGARMLRVFARLGSGVSAGQAETEMRLIAARQEQAYPESNAGLGVHLTPLHEAAVGKVRPTLLVLFAAVGCLLLIAGVNVANLVLARATTRQAEIAVRIALGASPARLARQLLTETAVLSLAGCGLGILLAGWSVRLLTASLPAAARGSIPRPEEIDLHAPVLAFAVAVSFAACLMCGLGPVFNARRAALAGALRERGGASGARSGLRDALIVAEIALALLLVAGAGLAIRSFGQISAIDPGFEPGHAFTATVSLSGPHYRDRAARTAFVRNLGLRLEALPGVVATGSINHLPLTGDVWTNRFLIEGLPAPLPGQAPSAIYRVTQPGYFRAMGAALLAGRDFTEHDDAAAPLVAIVNDTLARRFWPGQNALGKRIKWSGPNDPWLTIVGVVRGIRQWEWAGELQSELYQPFLQDSGNWRALTFVFRTAGDPAALAEPMRREVTRLDRDVPVSDAVPLAAAVSGAVWPARFNMVLLGGFGILAVLLAAVGIYGVTAYAVARRTQEIGIRMALGADPARVLGMVAGRALRLTLTGIGLGLGGALALTRLMTSLLYHVSPTDPLTFSLVAAGVTAVALCASWLPARRATRIDPMVALRYQ